MSRFVAGVCLCAAFAAAQQREPRKDVNFYSIEKEIAFGQQLAAEFRRTATLLDNAAALAYIRGLGQRLAAEIGGPPFSYSFSLIAGDPTVLHEVAAFPGGFLFVPAPLILASKDEDELAGMLAHAIAHVASRHATRAATREQLMNMSGQPPIFMDGPAGHAMRQGAALSMPLGLLQLRRRMELEADRLAAAKMAAVGYDPAALARYIDREQASYDDNSSKTFAVFPPRTRRVEVIRAVIAELPAREYGPHERFAAVQEEVRRALAR